jgi:hypothetical protein
MMTIDALFLFVALVCFLLAAIGVPAKVNLLALGLACWVLTLLV